MNKLFWDTDISEEFINLNNANKNIYQLSEEFSASMSMSK